MEAANARVTEAVNKLIDDVDRSCLRKIQVSVVTEDRTPPKARYITSSICPGFSIDL